MTVPASRIRVINDRDICPDRDYVLHWMIGYRRIDANFAVERAADYARELGKPLLVVEALRAGYRWASDRFHQFVIDGMRDNRARLAGTGVGYYPYLEPRDGDGKGLLQALAARACVVTTDDYPSFFLPAMVDAAGAKLDVRLEAVDSNGLMPVRATERVFERAQDFRRYVQKTVAPHLEAFPAANPLKKTLPPLATVPQLDRWPVATLDEDVADFPIDHDVYPTELRGGAVKGLATARVFIRTRLRGYMDGRNHPDDDAASGLSPYLHWGHVSVHQIVALVQEHEEWTLAKLAKPNGKREGFWGMSANAEAFLDELITWRELGFNTAALKRDYDAYETLPAWAQKTLSEHAGDKRQYIYSLQELESAKTYDDVWNAAQRQLVREGRIHNYLRMLWGKKVLEWSASPRQALATLMHLNDKYALDGRDPNSTSGIFWVFGRYDRPWGPKRRIFGTVRYMTSASTVRKIRMRDYLNRFSTM